MNAIDDKKKLSWQCRRGMLELDVILSPFLELHYDNLEPTQKEGFVSLLTEADPDIYTWLMGYGECEKAALLPIIKTIRSQMRLTS